MKRSPTYSLSSRVSTPFSAGLRLAIFAGLSFTVGLITCQAQWLTQTNVILPGWSAVYLNVDASGTGQTLDQLVGNNPANPVDQIWLWKSPISSAQYLATPESPYSSSGQWITWTRTTGTTNPPATLQTLIANTAYLVHSTAATNYSWHVQGKPTSPSYSWDMTGLNFIGFCTPVVSPPTFQSYFAMDPTIASIVQIFDYVGGDFGPANPAQIYSQFSTPVTRGQAYWVSATNVNNSYFGPFQVNLPNPSGLNYGTAGGQFTVRLVNVTTNSLTVTMSLQQSETPPNGQTNIVAVPPLLLEGALNSSNLTYACTAVTVGSPASWTLPANSSIAVVLGVNQLALTAPAGSLYAGFLRFTDSLGFSDIDVPVSAVSANNAGLWVGSASISQVASYLKTYATNIDGSYQMIAFTNYISTTNYATLTGTNLFILNAGYTNQVIANYCVTNQVFNIYSNTASLYVTNAWVATNTANVISTVTTNVVVTTTVTNFFYSAGQIVWQTTTATNVVVSASSFTNQAFGSLALSTLATNGAPVLETNLVINTFNVINQMTTNGIFLGPVTYGVSGSSSSTTNWVTATNFAATVVTTNLAAQPTLAISASVTNFAITNCTTSFAAWTNACSTNQPLAVFTNILNGFTNWTTVNLITCTNVSTNVVLTTLTTNYQYITNLFTITDGVTNPVPVFSTTNLVNTAYGVSTTLSNATLAVNWNLFLATNAANYLATNPVAIVSSNYVVTAVNTNLGPVVTPYPLRLIVFNDGTNCTLLQRVFYGIQNGTTNPVVATVQSAIDPAQLGTARRISASHLPWSAANTTWPFANLNGLAGLNGTMTATVFEPYDDQAANPFLHTYHPDHNNLDLTKTPPRELSAGSQSYNITRLITLSVQSGSSDFISLTKANSKLSGNYVEAITLGGNLGSRTFNTAGTFTLTRISPIATLTTQ